MLCAVSLRSAIGLGHLSALSEQLVKSTALESAAQQSEMLVAAVSGGLLGVSGPVPIVRLRRSG